MFLLFLLFELLQGFLPFELILGNMAQLIKLSLLLLGFLTVLCDTDACYEEH